ncbi:MAG TPA: response regulator [Bryobacteraceae bacterium]|nr:response regulator [Bryobacteraceae bacterium]
MLSATESSPLNVLLVEDNPADVLLIQEALSARFPVSHISVHQDGEQTMQWIERLDRKEVSRPDVILLDLNLPRVTGEDVLWRLSLSPLCRGVPIVVVTSSDSPRDRIAAAGMGASRYFRKPADYDEFMRLGDLVKGILAHGGTW